MLEKIVANNPDAIKDAKIDREKDLLIVQERDFESSKIDAHSF